MWRSVLRWSMWAPGGLWHHRASSLELGTLSLMGPDTRTVPAPSVPHSLELLSETQLGAVMWVMASPSSKVGACPHRGHKGGNLGGLFSTNEARQVWSGSSGLSPPTHSNGFQELT